MKHKELIKKAFAGAFAVLIFAISLLSVFAEGETIPEPELETAKSALVYCVQAEKVVWSKGADDSRYPAGAAKMMTAILAIEHYGDEMEDTFVTATAAALRNSAGSSLGLRTGEMLPAKDLIAAVILSGSNDAAYVLAADIGGTVAKFVNMMNEKAEAMGMKNTHYTNPSGLHDGDMVTTANDLVLLAKYCYNNSTYMELCGMTRYAIDKTNKTDGDRIIANRNYFINVAVTNEYYYSIVNGMSISNTEQAGYSLIASGKYDGTDYIVIALGCEDVTEVVKEEEIIIDELTGEVTVIPEETKTRNTSYSDGKALFRHAIRNYSFKKIIDVSTIVCEIPVRLGMNTDHVTLLPEHSIDFFLPNNEDPKSVISYAWELDKGDMTAPVEMGQEAGVLTVYYKGEVIEKLPLVAKNNVERSEWLYLIERIGSFAKTPLFRITAIVIVILIAVYFISAGIRKKKKNDEARREFNRKYRDY